MKKKLLSLFLLVCVACGSLTGCLEGLGGSSASSESSSASSLTSDTSVADSDSTTADNSIPSSDNEAIGNSSVNSSVGESSDDSFIESSVDSSTDTSVDSSNDSVDSSVDSSIEEIEPIDYVSQATLDLTSTDTQKLEININSYTHIDGDTTHFRNLTGDNVPDTYASEKVIKVRYLAVNTPESTGEIEEWGKAASKFTKTKLASASSVIIESDGAEWATDSNGRYLVWVWYKPSDSDTYRNLNLELLQNGLALANNIDGSRYEEQCMGATIQAQALQLYVFSDEKDPDYFYGEALNTDLKTVRTNLEYYSGKRVALTGVVTVWYGKGSIYLEDQDVEDEETGLYYGMPIFYGMGNLSWSKVLAPGNKVFIVGEVSYSEGWGYQICNLKYNPMRNDPENIRVIGEAGAYPPAYTETTLETFYGKATIHKNLIDEDTGKFVTYEDGTIATVSKEYDYAELVLATSISMKGLKVIDTYTTKTGTSEGAMTLTCKDAKGKEIEIRTIVLYDENNEKVTADVFEGKTIDVKGIVDYYESDYEQAGDSPYQIKVFNLSDFTIYD